MSLFGSTSSASSGLSFSGFMEPAGFGFIDKLKDRFIVPDKDDSNRPFKVGFLSKSSSASPDASFDSSVTNNNSLMEYLQGLMASTGQENVENRLFNASEAQKNRDWLTEMSNTSYQRAVADLQKAGLNPILAYQHGGASTPSSSSASYNVGGGDSLTSLLQVFASLLSSGSDIAKVLTILAGA